MLESWLHLFLPFTRQCWNYSREVLPHDRISEYFIVRLFDNCSLSRLCQSTYLSKTCGLARRDTWIGVSQPELQSYDLIFFGHENSLFGHNRFSTFFFSMKMAESEKIVLASCILDFKDIQVWLRHFSLNLNACRVMTVFYEIPGQIFKTRFKLKCLNQTCISLKSSMQLARTIFLILPSSMRLWPKSEFCGQKKIHKRIRKSWSPWYEKGLSFIQTTKWQR